MTNEKVKIMMEISLCAAIGFLLDILQNLYSGAFWPYGGSIGISMLAVFVMSFRRGIKAGFLTGLLMGLLDLADGFYAISDAWWKVFFQLGMDYIFAFAVVGFAGLTRPFFLKTESKKKIALYLSIGCLIGGMLKFLLHYFSGIIFFGSYFDSSIYPNVWVYSFCYNMPFVIISTVLSAIILIGICLKQPQLFKLDKEE